MWLHFSKAANRISDDPLVILVALVLSGLVASIVLAREVTGSFQVESTDIQNYPSYVFRAPHPAILALVAGSTDDGR